MTIKSESKFCHYNGPERRIRPINDRRCELNCFEHSGLVERISENERSIRQIEGEGFLTSAAYRWTTGILVSILISILSATIYATFQASEALREVKAAQQTLAFKMDFIKADIEDLKKRKVVNP